MLITYNHRRNLTNETKHGESNLSSSGNDTSAASDNDNAEKEMIVV